MASPPSIGRGLLDTSVFTATETGRRLDEAKLPDQAAVSVVSLAELRVGVLAASDAETAARRLATVERIAQEAMTVLPIDAAAANWWALARVRLARSERRVNVNDLWIAATASSHGIPVVTQDADFEAIEEIMGLAVVRL